MDEFSINLSSSCPGNLPISVNRQNHVGGPHEKLKSFKFFEKCTTVYVSLRKLIKVISKTENMQLKKISGVSKEFQLFKLFAKSIGKITLNSNFRFLCFSIVLLASVTNAFRVQAVRMSFKFVNGSDWLTEVTFFLSGRFFYFKFWNSDTVDFEMKWLNIKIKRFLNATRCYFFDYCSLATLVATFVFWTHFWYYLSRCSTDCWTYKPGTW